MEKSDRKHSEWPWLIATLGVASVYSLLALRLAFRSPNLVQDDARQHVFWMHRFIDPTLFPNDLIADYFQAVAPAGYKAIYWIFAEIGVQPLSLSRILPAVIGVVTAWVTFRFFARLAGDARGAFFASVIICQLLWLKDDMISATPRAFVAPLFLGFLLFLIERRVVLCLLLLALQGLFYPQAALVSLCVLILRMIDWKDRHLLSRDRIDYVLAIGGIAVLGIVLSVFASSVSRYGPVITPAEARALPEFLKHGRAQFYAGGIAFWLSGERSGIRPDSIPTYLFVLSMVGLGLLLFWRTVPALGRLRQRRALLGQVAMAALVMWAAAHLLLFKLHLPARYSQWALRLLLGMTAAAATMSIFAATESWRERLHSTHQQFARLIPALLPCFVVLLIIAPMFVKKFPNRSFVEARPQRLFAFLETQPKNVVIATLRENGSKIPLFARRTVLVSAEHAIPYHMGYYRVIRERGRDLVKAFLTPDADVLRTFIEKYHVDLFILPRAPITPAYVKKRRWFRDVITPGEMESSEKPSALSGLVERSKVWENQNNIIVDSHLILEMIRPNEISTPR